MDVLHSISHTSRIHDVKFVLPVGVESTDSPSTSELLLVGAEDKKTTVYEIHTSADERTKKPRVVAELVGHTNRIKAIETIQIALPPSPSPTTSSSTTTPSPTKTTIACTVSSDGFIHIYDLSPLSTLVQSNSEGSERLGTAAEGKAIMKLEPVARYDTNKTRLTCVAVADGDVDVEGGIGGKRKRDEDDEEEGGDEEEEGEGDYDEFEGIEVDEEEEEEEGEGEYEMESD
ncbi:hypothetical protein CVT24_011036 [Panaeolus cyanescens]|uniref:Uncharacterized protein n=1 Tax=Panaeolus cyanescens TaxID=181874 RepID=A0A409VFY9_9AGAR|nr:hypothetical protein CVT24_011036 [Panaeolus cyanescens]